MEFYKPIIEIDDYDFKLQAGYINEEGRKFILISSFTKGERDIRKMNGFAAYKSMSEGFWRFLHYDKDSKSILTGSGNTIYKCHNEYITCTFLHFSLQCFIEKNFDKLHKLDKENFMLGLEMFGSKIEKESIYNRSYEEDDAFLLISKATSTETIVMGNNYIKAHTIIDVFFGIEKPNFKDEQPGEIMLVPRGDRIYLPYYDEKQTLYLNYIKSLIDKDLYDTLKIDEKIKVVYNSISEFFETLFKIDREVQEYICSLNIELTDYGDNQKKFVKFPFHVYRTIFKNRCENKTYYLYYACYEYEGKQYKIICNIIPFENKVLFNGLYDKYISASPYIYKMFEYGKQCGYIGCDIGKVYKFIGDFQTNVFPLTQLDFQIPPSQGGKRKTRKNKKNI